MAGAPRRRPLIPPSGVEIRQATPADLPACARLGARLSRLHHRLDPQRFFAPPDLEAGYAWWLAKERRSRRAVVLAAVRQGKGGRQAVVGYAYGRLEPRDWNSLRDACGVGVDLIVEPRWRRRGLGARLMAALGEALRARGAPRLIVQVAARNPQAIRTFEALGFRPTLLELTLEFPAPRSPRAARAVRRPGGGRAVSPARPTRPAR